MIVHDQMMLVCKQSLKSAHGVKTPLPEVITCRNAGQSVAMIKQGRDVDELKDLIALTRLLRQDERPARRMLLKLVDKIVSPLKIPYG